MEIEEYPQN